jgi:site-specific DNA-methyltransferase (adenine-specific)
LTEHGFINGLNQSWGGHSCWMNPPYSQISKWVAKAVDETTKDETTRVVCLLPARTDTKWFHELVVPNADEIIFLKGRIMFVGGDSSAPFPSMIVIFYIPQVRNQVVKFEDWKYK